MDLALLRAQQVQRSPFVARPCQHGASDAELSNKASMAIKELNSQLKQNNFQSELEPPPLLMDVALTCRVELQHHNAAAYITIAPSAAWLRDSERGVVPLALHWQWWWISHDSACKQVNALPSFITVIRDETVLIPVARTWDPVGSIKGLWEGRSADDLGLFVAPPAPSGLTDTVETVTDHDWLRDNARRGCQIARGRRTGYRRR